MFGKDKETTSPEIAGLEELIALLNEKIKGGIKSRKKPAVDALAVEVEPEGEAPELGTEEPESSETDPADLEAALAAIGGKEDEDELV